MAFVLNRMLIVPVVNVALVWLLAGDVIVADEADTALIKLILVIEAVVPSADLCIAVSQQAKRYQGAEGLSVAYLFQYLVGIGTFTAGIAFGIDFAFEEFGANGTLPANASVSA